MTCLISVLLELCYVLLKKIALIPRSSTAVSSCKDIHWVFRTYKGSNMGIFLVRADRSKVEE